jgi:PBP1b-binding outer membrane lipoprotein LpoB
MKKLSMIGFILLLVGCGAKPEPKPEPQPNQSTTAPKPTAKPSTPEPISAPTSTPSCTQDNYACQMKLLGEEALGSLKTGLTAKEVLTLLKAPEKKGTIQEEEATGLFVQTWDYPTLGVSLQMASETKKGAQSINSLSLAAPSTYKTKRGIGIGGTLAALKSAYQNAMSKEDLDRTDPEGSYLAGSVYGGLSFQLKGGQISEIFMGAMAE